MTTGSSLTGNSFDHAPPKNLPNQLFGSAARIAALGETEIRAGIAAFQARSAIQWLSSTSAMKTSFTYILLPIILSVGAIAQTTVVVNEPLARGKVVAVNPQSKVMTVMVEPGNTSMDFYGLERARIEKPGGRRGTLAEVRPGTTVAVYYSSQDGRWYPQRILIPDANLAVPISPLTPAEQKALHSKAANDGDITTNPGVKARIDKDITTQPGRKDPADPDITKKGK